MNHVRLYAQKLGHKSHKSHNCIKTPINKGEGVCDLFVTFCDFFIVRVLRNLYNVTEVTKKSQCNCLIISKCDICDVCDLFS